MTQQTAIDQLIALDCSNIPAPIPQRNLIKVGGDEKSGKSYLACTAPPPIIYFSIDRGTEGVVEKFQAEKQILVYEIRYKPGLGKEVYEGMWAEMRKRLDIALTLGTGTIVFDTFSEIYELARYAHFGRILQVPATSYPQVYPDLRQIVDDIESTNMSAVFLTKMMPGFDTKELEEKGFNEMRFRAQTNIITHREMVVDPATGLSKPVFSFTVKDSRTNINMSGMTFSSQQVVAEGKVEDYFNLEKFIYLLHNWKV